MSGQSARAAPPDASTSSTLTKPPAASIASPTNAPNSSNPYNLPQPPTETLALLESLGMQRPEPVHHNGTISTPEERLQLRDEHPMTRARQDDNGQWLIVEMGTNNYWDVGEPLASDMSRRHKAMEERLANLSDEDRRRLEEQFQPQNATGKWREVKERQREVA